MSAAVEFRVNRDRALLPPNASKWMHAVSQVSADQRPLDIDIIRRVWNPWDCPVEFLPFLAAAFSVDLWEDNWPITRKRSIIANAVELHHLKGTYEGLVRHLAYVDVKVLKATTPPQKVFSGARLSKEAREAWLSKLPQVRVYRSLLPGKGGRRVFTGGGLNKQFAARRFFQPNDSLKRLARKAEWVVNGVADAAFVEPYNDGGYRIRLRGVAGSKVFCGKPVGRRFFQPSDSAKRLLTVSVTANAPWRSDLSPSLKPVSSEPELVAVRAPAGSKVFCGKPIGKRFFQRSNAAFRLYERFAVNDGSTPLKRPAIQFMGVGQYGAPAHTAVVKIEMRGRRSRRAAGSGVLRPGTKFWLPHDAEPMRRLKRAIVAAKRRSDVILIDTNNITGFIAGQPWPVGQPYVV